METKDNIAKGDMQRVRYLDIAKGIGIILVVYAHTHAALKVYINHFHMPFFFLVSGFLFSPKSSVRDFVARKVKSLYIPFVFWNLIVWLVKMGDSFKLAKFLRFAPKVLLTLTKEGDYLGPTWFLAALFTESILYKILDTVIKPSKYKRWGITLFYILRAMYAFSHTLDYKLSRTFILGMFFAIGYLVKENVEFFRKYHGRIACGVSVLLFFLIGTFTVARLSSNQYTSPTLYVIGALAGSYFLICLSQWIDKHNHSVVEKVGRLLCYLSKRSIDIVIWHVITFKLLLDPHLSLWVSIRKSFWQMFPVEIPDKRWWLIYVVVGVTIPLLWTSLLRTGPWGKLLKKLHIV